MPEQNNITNSLAQGKYPWGIIINSRFVKIVSSSPVTQTMIADEKAARQKNHEKQYVFHGFLLFMRQKRVFMKSEVKIIFQGCFFVNFQENRI